MRALFFSAIVFATLPARAESLAEVCQRLIGSQVTQCMAAGNGRHINPDAVGQCGRLISGQVISCVGAIAGKDYSPDEAQACGSLISGQVIECFRRTGRPHERRADYPPPRGPFGFAEIRAEIAAAIEQIRAGDPGGAEMRLRRLLNDMR